MNKIASAIQAKQLNLRLLPQGQIIPIDVTSELLPSVGGGPLHQDYRIGVQIWAAATIPAGDERALEDAIDRTRRHLCEQVFGEFREHICRIEICLMNHDIARAREQVENLRRAMFGDRP